MTDEKSADRQPAQKQPSSDSPRDTDRYFHCGITVAGTLLQHRVVTFPWLVMSALAVLLCCVPGASASHPALPDRPVPHIDQFFGARGIQETADITGNEIFIYGNTIISITEALAFVHINNAYIAAGTLSDTRSALRNDTATLIGTVDAPHIKTQRKSLAESRIASIGILTSSADMLEQTVIPQLRSHTPQARGPVPFGVMGGSTIRYNSDSRINQNGFSLLTGLGWKGPSATKDASLLGGFVEAGWGSYDSHNSFAGGAVRGNGSTSYYGGGLLGRYDAAFPGSANVYIEGSLRTGQIETDYHSGDFISASGNDVSFDSSAPYYGAHFGVGCAWNPGAASNVDVYTKYLWARQGNDSMNIEGDRTRFQDTHSHRWRTGMRYGTALKTDSGEHFTPYIGLACEYEFDARVKANTNDNPIGTPDIKGATGLAELGLSVKLSTESAFSFDLSMQGFTGKREGGGGNVLLKYEF